MWPYFALIATTWFASYLKRDNLFRYILFGVPTILIVGLRYEVGFDWPVYSNQFYAFQTLGFFDFFSRIPELVVLYAQEPLFLIISYLMAQILPYFEIFQLLAYILFLYSIFSLGKAMGSHNVIGAMIPIHFFLLFTLEFSTLRQNIAISFFNFGLAFLLNNKRSRGIIFQGAAIFIQSSTAIYILIQLWTNSVKRWTKIAILLSAFLAVFLSAGGLQLIPSSFLPGFLGDKLNYYLNNRGYDYNVYEQLFFFVLFIAIAFLLNQSKSSLQPNLKFVANLIVFFCLFALMAFLINTIRNRLMYEIIILTSLIAYGPRFKLQIMLKVLLLASGVIFFAASMTKQSSIAIVPYQNYVWFMLNGLESDGPRRQEEMWYYLRDAK